ncbi:MULTISPECIES: NAD(P)-dependent oxidoreductase [unclassified Sinorhizobium]|uniref:NAD-dependent epimerase/dehydratase family protein n=1 Tax=unclassified Sinorhizobium TaxID=2613772 RepID=UPI0024C4093D|nr:MULTISPECIES: NAD(P)-dependent oxidoreductase [unclassified Sinorhizobium]MDK1374230.1 NAD(P)-dependent oxidoreductase [Sinorhizobium sp. 6-70]MDK1481622.1 NAD(P)-dependent oxidoreductase [Sinorhizobium sp. 6-117]
MSRILITGGAGFVGSHLARACVAAGHEVHLIIRPGSDDRRIEDLRGEIIRHNFDLQSETALKHCFSDVSPEQIFHLAARPRRAEAADLSDVRDGMREQVQVLIGLLSAAAGAARPPKTMIRTGSLAEYGAASAPFQEDMREIPVNAYGAELVAATHLLGALQRRLPFPVVTARLALVYGASQSTAYLLPWLITRCLAGEASMVRNPQDRRDLIHVDDAVGGLLRLAEAQLPGGTIINIATGFAPAMRDVARLIIAETGADPMLVSYGPADGSSGIPDFRAATALARSLLGWSASTPLAEGLVETVAWYREQTRSQEPLAQMPAVSRRERTGAP